MSKKKITAIVLAAIFVLAIGGNLIYSHIAGERENSQTLQEGVKLVAYEIGMYLETENEDYFHQASTDLQSLELIAEDDDSILSTDYRKEAFLSIISAFIYDEEELMYHAERLKKAFDLIGENADEDYPYAQLYIVLNDIT